MYFNYNNCCTKYIYYKIIINNYILINLVLLIVSLWINDNNCNLYVYFIGNYILIYFIINILKNK